MQAFVKTAGAIYKKIQDGVFDVSNEVVLFISQIITFALFRKNIVSPIDVTLSIIYAYTHVVMYLLFHFYYIQIQILRFASKPKSLLPILYKAHPLFLRTFMY